MDRYVEKKKKRKWTTGGATLVSTLSMSVCKAMKEGEMEDGREE